MAADSTLLSDPLLSLNYLVEVNEDYLKISTSSMHVTMPKIEAPRQFDQHGYSCEVLCHLAFYRLLRL